MSADAWVYKGAASLAMTDRTHQFLHNQYRSTVIMKKANLILPLSLLVAGTKLVRAAPATLPSISFVM